MNQPLKYATLDILSQKKICYFSLNPALIFLQKEKNSIKCVGHTA